jgi:hypothetical protein
MNLQNLIEEMEEFSHCEILAEENHTFTEVTDLWKSAIQALKTINNEKGLKCCWGHGRSAFSQAGFESPQFP